MSRILAIDYGKKRSGLAVSDPLQISINPMPTLLTKDLYNFIEDYLKNEVVETLVIGYPTHKDGTPTYLVKDIETFLSRLIKKFPCLEIVREDEFNTSRDARNNMILMGVKKKKRQQKEEIDKGSAILILKSYLNRKFML